jgi:hypothetical protein
MGTRVEIEDIEAMRRRVGVDDVELRGAIRGLRVGDRVRLTLLAGPAPAARRTVLVQITGIRGPEFRGKLASPGPPGIRPGARIAFTATHIHSVPDERPAHAGRRS